jgi:D-alanyl-D-alanine dipeptidase
VRNPYHFQVNRSFILLLLIAIAFMPADAQKKKAAKKAAPAKPPATLPVPEPYRDILANAQQAVLVTTPGWNNVDGTLQRFEKKDGHWERDGEKVPIVVGKSGFGWDGITEPPPASAQPIKKEGDGRSPAGIFKITELFGFQSSLDSKVPYRPLTESVECVDDASSQSYNQIVDRKEIPNPDWNSSEKMRTIDVYKVGAVVDYNSPKVPRAGSCIFLHIWKGPGHGTAGCTAMEENHVQEIIQWLDEKRQPILIQLPQPMYDRVREIWQLP